MTIRINNLSLGLDDDIKLLKKKASKKLRISVDEIKDFKIGNKALVSNKNWTLMFSDLEVVALSLSALRAELMPDGCLISSCHNNHISVLT